MSHCALLQILKSTLFQLKSNHFKSGKVLKYTVGIEDFFLWGGEEKVRVTSPQRGCIVRGDMG